MTLPIGGRIALPSSINTYVSILKNTAILGPAISFPEPTYQAYSLDSTYFKAAEIYVLLAVIYLAIVWALSADPRFSSRGWRFRGEYDGRRARSPTGSSRWSATWRPKA